MSNVSTLYWTLATIYFLIYYLNVFYSGGRFEMHGLEMIFRFFFDYGYRLHEYLIS